ncbi:thiamine-phosphate kinase [Knoellia koreensis]|uniref:Thiamine-monophosphate kinase n=1 Tax=Knoellia koreensis TaxID=2730921 RepID=A0A849HH89_9MICO|nr:thiamine-phosphate kinase [Knoellia sp. DB2414S]NNM45641.1 thiamine-phosphate kinase [Knoellia sp. DB2414S]
MVTDPRTLADVSEGALLAEIFPLLQGGPRMPVGPGDDAAVLATGPASVVTTDSMVRGLDWLDEWSTPADVATKLLTQNLADVAAMGATPTAVLVSLMADPQVPVEWVLEFARGLGESARLSGPQGVAVAGGDLSSAPPGVLVLSMTAFGDLDGREPVLRSGARPGDVVTVYGTLGRSGAGLAMLLAGADPGSQPPGIRAECIAHHLRPVAPIPEGAHAADAGATSMIDISDGLLRDGHRIAAASGVRLALTTEGLEPHVRSIAGAVGDDALEQVLTGGEEHSLLATFAGEPPRGWWPIGRVEEGDGVTLDGEPQQPRGWDHFSG